MSGALARTVLATSLCFAIVQLDTTIVNISLISIGENIRSDMSDLQWMVDAYTLAFASFLLTAGDVGDRYGARRVFVSGVVLFLVASAVCCFAQSAAQLIALRGAQGVGAAFAFPNSHALLNHACADRSETRARAFGVWNAVGGLATAAGPVVGGALVETLGWRSIFLVNIPICILIIYITSRYVDEAKRGGAFRSVDLPAQLLSICSMLFLIWGIVGSGARDGNGMWAALCFCASIYTFYAFIEIQRKSACPLLPIQFFANSTFSASIAVGFLNNMAYYGFLFALGFYLQAILNYSVLQASFVFIPLAGSALSNLLGGKMSAQWGPRFPMTTGFLLAAVGFGSFLPVLGETSYLQMLPPLILISLGLGLAVPPITVALLSTVDTSRSGIASATLTTARQVGCATGVAIYGSIINGQLVSPTYGIQICFVGGVVFCAAASAISAIWVDRG